MHIIFLIRQCPDIQVTAIHTFPKIYLDIKMSAFEAKKRKYVGRFYKYTRQHVLSLIIQHQIKNKMNDYYKFYKVWM